MNSSARPPLARLVVTGKGQGVRVYEVHDGGQLHVGRDLGSEILIEDPRVSRVHACIFGRSSKCFATDLFSRNGTFINGERLVGDRELRSQDIINIGATVITVEILASVQKTVTAAETTTGGIVNAVIPTAMFRSLDSALTEAQSNLLEGEILREGGRNLLRQPGWVLAGWPGRTIKQTAPIALCAISAIIEKLGADVPSLGVFVFTMRALLDGPEPEWTRVSLMGDPEKVCEEFNELLRSFIVRFLAEKSIVEHLPSGFQGDIAATIKMKGESQTKILYGIRR